MAGQLTPEQAAQLNLYARNAIKARAIRMTQPIFSGNFNPANTPQVTVNPRNVGLIKGFWVKVTHTISNGSAVQINLTDFGPANALSNVQFNDLNNITRINTPGWHVAFVDSAKSRRPFGSAMVQTTGFDAPTKYGSNWTQQISAPATIAAAGTGTVIMWYWVPLAYGEDDLRGSVFANVVNATMQLNLSFPGATGGVTQNGVTVCATNGTDSTQAMYVGNAAGSVALVSITNTNVAVSQVYMDQIPVDKTYGVLLPTIDLATIYELKQTTIVGAVANQDFPYQYTNFRDFLSTFAIYVNTGATGARGVGADINFWSLQSANATNIWKKEPGLIALENRNFLGADFPPGVYYFSTRERPISTTQFGNMQLINNPITAGAGAYQLMATEDFALQATLSMAGSLAAS